MDTLKRPYNGDGETGVAVKKRAISSTPGSPPRQVHVNGNAKTPEYDDPLDEDDLERFRKAALFRRMRRYAKECERYKKRVESMEDVKKEYDGWLILMETCWTRLTKTLTSVIGVNKSDDPMLSEVDNIPAIFDKIFSERTSQSTRAQNAKEMEKLTITLVKVLLERSGVMKNGEQAAKRLQRAEDERSDLHAQVRMLEKKNADLLAQKDELSRDLAGADRRVEKLEKEVRSLKRNTNAVATNHSSPAVETTELVVKGEGANGTTLTQSPQLDSSAPAPSQSSAEELSAHAADAIAHRDGLIAALESECALLRDQQVMTKSELALLPENVIVNTQTYMLLLEHAQHLQERAELVEKELKTYQHDLVSLKKSMHDTNSEQKEGSDKEVAETKALIKKRDDDLTRLRQERFNLETKLQEQKTKLESATASNKEFKALRDSQEERIKVLCSEVQRLRTRLAQQGGQEDVLKFIFRDSDIKLDYVQDLQARLKESEEQLDAVRRVDSQAVRSGKLDLMKELGEAKKRLAEIEAKYGTDIDLAGLKKQLDVKDGELRSAGERETQLNQQLEVLMTEVDRLSVSWETLNEQIQHPEKGFKCWEEEREKIFSQKARTDNLYFKIKKEVEAKESECKQATRNVEKQMKIIETLTKSEKNLTQLNASLETQLEETKFCFRQCLEQRRELDRECQELKLRQKSEYDRVNMVREELATREKTVAGLHQDIVKLKEKLSKVGRELEKAKSSANVKRPVGSASEREEALQKENSKYADILKCSTCRNEFRSRVITKCMHTFCKSCVDARIQHRSRKCPACNLAFAQGDVQQIYFQ
ncbi:hypothetical protein SCHPADRAFT_910821 [Schizopora paradoxa]|uniref:E3 ubiquitin protein ligase n=1 Tax=Schizopora paradoxa TaxID=27342 RepID=A0A0H2R321_9AGAM|nr:hypothetical protein SCHPADRAFT_910821 [Schizopora paradoxa]